MAARTQGDGSPPANASNGESPTDSCTQIGFHGHSTTTSHVDHSQSRTVAPRSLPAAKHRITAASLRRREISPPKVLIRSGEKEQIIPCDIAKLLGPISDPERHLPWISPTAARLARRPKSHRINAMHREASDELGGGVSYRKSTRRSPRRWERRPGSSTESTDPRCRLTTDEESPRPRTLPAFSCGHAGFALSRRSPTLPRPEHRICAGKITSTSTLKFLQLFSHGVDRKSTRLNSSHSGESRMPSSA